MPKIPALPPMTSVDTADEIPIEDVSAGTTKYITLTKLKEWFQSLTGWITAAMIAGIDRSLLTTDSNPYKFLVYRNAAQNSSAAFAKINFDAEVFDTNNNFDSTTNRRYVAPVAGFYWFHWQVATPISGAGSDCVSAIYKNGTIYAWGSESSTSMNSPGGLLMQLAASDYVEIFNSTTNVVAFNVGGSPLKTYFSGALLSRT